MSGDDISAGSDVVLGFDAAWGYASADQTSPALAAAAGALLDTSMRDQPVTELRIHGVSGSDGPTMLEHPAALQVAGDAVTGFSRRWSPQGGGAPSIAWKLEAYSWGGLTERPLASASWLLLAPFMMYNVAYFMLPPDPAGGDTGEAVPGPVPHLRRGAGHRVAGVLLRLLALAATVQFVSAAVSVLVSTVGWQAAGRPGTLPGWMGWYGEWTAGWRVALALAAVAAVVGLLWWVSVATASRYEGRISIAPAELNARWPLTQPGFWKGGVLVARQRTLHAAAACAAAALIVALPAGHAAAARWAAVLLAASVLAAAALSIVSPLASRHRVTLVHGGRAPRRAAPGGGTSGSLPRGGGHGGAGDGWCRGVLAAALAALVTAALVSGWADRRPGPQTGALPGLTGFLAMLLAAQTALLVALTAVVVVLARRAPDPGGGPEDRPYLRGGLAALFAWLGFALGGLLTAVVSFGVTRLLGTPVPGGFRFAIPPPGALAVPWPVYAFGAAPAGLLAGAVLAAIALGRAYRRNRTVFGARADDRPSPVARAYAAATAGPAASAGPAADGSRAADGSPGDAPAYDRNRAAIARAWSLGLLADHAAAAVALVTGGGVAVAAAAEAAAAASAGPAGRPALLAGWWHGLATLIALAGALAACWLVLLLRAAYADPARRRTIGALWDVATFWPRAVHPLAPPCYGERAVPELVDRIRLLTGHPGSEPDDAANLHAQAGRPDLDRAPGIAVPAGPVLVTGYSQGSVIAPAVIAQLPPDARRDVALLTLACPARRLYGRAFPAYFGPPQLAVLAGLLDCGLPRSAGRPPGRWKNLRRRSDYIGSWVVAEPPPRLSDADLRGNVDQPCWDPVVLVPDANPTPPPTHRHSRFWQDPRTGEVAAYLVGLLTPPAAAEPGPPPGPEELGVPPPRVGPGAGAEVPGG